MAKYILTLLMAALGLAGCQTTTPLPVLPHREITHFAAKEPDVIQHLEWSPSGDQLLLSSKLGYVGVMDVAAGQHVFFHQFRKDDPDFAGLLTARWTQDGRIFVALNNDETQIWSKDLSKKVFSHRFSGGAYTASISPNGRYIGYGNHIFDIQTQTLLTNPSLSGTKAAGFVNDQNYLLGGGRSGIVALWGLNANSVKFWRMNKPALALPGHKGSRFAIATGEYPGMLSKMNSGFNFHTLTVYDAKTSALLGTISANMDHGVAFSTDDSWLACAGDDNRIRVFDATSLKPLLVTQALPSGLKGMTTSRELLAAWYNAGEITVWDINEKNVLGQINILRKGRDSDPVVAVAIDRDQKRIAVAFRSGEVEVLALSK